MIKYKLISVNWSDRQRILEEEAADGWELVTVSFGTIYLRKNI